MKKTVEPEVVTVNFVCEQHKKETESERLVEAIFNGEPLCQLCGDTMVVDNVEIKE
jgi:hypothetical protein